MKIQLISSRLRLHSLITSLGVVSLVIFVPSLMLKSQAQPLIPDEIIRRQNFLDTDLDTEEEVTPSPFNPNWRHLTLLHTLNKHNAPVFALTFNPQGTILVSAGSFNDPVLRYWSIKSGKEIHSDRGHPSRITGLAYTPDGSTLVSTGKDSMINLWNGRNYKYISTFLEHFNSILNLAITPDGSTLVTGGLDGIRLWDLKYRRPTYTLAGVGNPSYALAMHPDGFIVASGDREGKVSLWNLRTAKLISEFTPHQKEINGLIFTPDGSKLITSSAETTIKIWDRATGELIREFVGHRDRLRTIALSPDGQTLASGGNDGVRIWDVNTGDLLAIVPSTNDWIQSLAFSPDSTMLAVGSFNSEITIWQARIGEPMATMNP
jgi:WD40 repeat protein